MREGRKYGGFLFASEINRRSSNEDSYCQMADSSPPAEAGDFSLVELKSKTISKIRRKTNAEEQISNVQTNF